MAPIAHSDLNFKRLILTWTDKTLEIKLCQPRTFAYRRSGSQRPSSLFLFLKRHEGRGVDPNRSHVRWDGWRRARREELVVWIQGSERVCGCSDLRRRDASLPQRSYFDWHPQGIDFLSWKIGTSCSRWLCGVMNFG